MISTQSKSLSLNPEALCALKCLKKAFCTAPMLCLPDLELPFTVEVDASTTGVGAVLTHWQGNPPCLYPCAYFSRKLSPEEQNYDIGNRELLAIKQVLKEASRLNMKADALSRQFHPDPESSDLDPILPPTMSSRVEDQRGDCCRKFLKLPCEVLRVRLTCPRNIVLPSATPLTPFLDQYTQAFSNPLTSVHPILVA